MTIRAQSADGMIHEFPAGTSMDIVDRAMGDYARTVRANQRVTQERQESPTLTAVDDRVRQVAKGVPVLGSYMDEISAGLNTGFGLVGDYDEELAYQRARDKTFEAERPVESTALQIGGGVAGGLGALKAGAPLLGAGKSLGARVATGGAVGAGVGAAEGFGRGEGGPEGRLESAGQGAVIGSLAGSAAPVVAAGIGKAVTALAPKPAVPDIDAIKAASQTAYQRADDAGLVLRPEAMQRLSQGVKADLADKGYLPRLQPKVAAVLEELDRVAEGNITLKGVDVLRRVANAAKTDTDPSTGMLGARIVSQIDDFLDTIRPDDAVMGRTREGVLALREARQGWATMRKAEIVDEALERATNTAKASGSGGNINNAIRQEFKGILRSPKQRKGFSPDEIAAMVKVVRGDAVQDALRLAGKLSPNGNGLMLLGNFVAAQMNPLALVGTAVGTVAKTAADGSTRRNVEQLSRVVRGGGTAAAVTPNPRLGNRIGSGAGLGLLSYPDDRLPYPSNGR